MNFLKGRKTYLVAAVIFVLGGLKALNVVDDHTYTMIVTLVAPLGVVALRSAVGNNGNS